MHCHNTNLIIQSYKTNYTIICANILNKDSCFFLAQQILQSCSLTLYSGFYFIKCSILQIACTILLQNTQPGFFPQRVKRPRPDPHINWIITAGYYTVVIIYLSHFNVQSLVNNYKTQHPTTCGCYMDTVLSSTFSS